MPREIALKDKETKIMFMKQDKKITCNICDELIEDRENFYLGDQDTHYEGKPLCETCYYEDEPIATVFYRDGEEPHYISHTRNETEGDFKATWHSTDAWRGYYEMESEKYTRVFSDTILAYHESEVMLKELNDLIIQEYMTRNIDFARVFPRTSNLFATGFDIWTEKNFEKLFQAYAILQDVKKQVNYDDPLYSTGIIFDRETLGKFQSLLGSKYQVERDTDVMELVKEKGSDLLEEIKQIYQTDVDEHIAERDNGINDR